MPNWNYSNIFFLRITIKLVINLYVFLCHLPFQIHLPFCPLISHLTKASSTKCGKVYLWQENNRNISKYYLWFMWCFVLGLSHFKTSCVIKLEKSVWCNNFKRHLKTIDKTWLQFWGNESQVLKDFFPIFFLGFLYVKYLNKRSPSLFEAMGIVLLLQMSQTQQKQDENRELRGD